MLSLRILYPLPHGEIPEKTIERLSEYRRTLLACHNQGITHIFSHVLAGIHGITAVQVRRDLMLIGFSSDTKKGLRRRGADRFYQRDTRQSNVVNIRVLGMGNLGQALTKYFNGRRSELRIIASFDVDGDKVGHEIDGIPCYGMESFEEQVQKSDIKIVILSSPTSIASELVVPIINAGIKGVLNFTSMPLNFPRGILSKITISRPYSKRSPILSRRPRKVRTLKTENDHPDACFYGFERTDAIRRPVVTIGSYDGVHRGHRTILARINALAAEQGGESVVVTFHPHPRVRSWAANR